MLIQEGIRESYNLVGVMVMKKGSVILPMWREYISMINEDNCQCKDNKIQKDPVTGPQSNITEILCKLVKEQSAPQVDLEPFDGNPPEYT